MKVQLLYIVGCPNHLPALSRLKTEMADEGLHLEVEEVEVLNESTAKSLLFPGSPTIRVNGADIEAGSDANTGTYACRVYRDKDTGQISGLPPGEMIRNALRQHRKTSK